VFTVRVNDVIMLALVFSSWLLSLTYRVFGLGTQVLGVGPNLDTWSPWPWDPSPWRWP